MHNSSPWPEKDGLKCKERIKIRCPIPSVLLPPSKAPVTWGLPRRESEKAGPCTISERKRKQHNKTRMSYGSQAPKTRDLIFVELFSWSFQVKNPTRLPTPNFLCPWLLCPVFLGRFSSLWQPWTVPSPSPGPSDKVNTALAFHHRLVKKQWSYLLRTKLGVILKTFPSELSRGLLMRNQGLQKRVHTRFIISGQIFSRLVLWIRE